MRGRFSAPHRAVCAAHFHGVVMIRSSFAIALLLMGLTPSIAQEYCEQVRQGIAQYGYGSAMRYAAEHYTADEVKAIHACVVKLRLRRQAAAEAAPVARN